MRKAGRYIGVFVVLLGATVLAQAQDFITTQKTPGAFPIVSGKKISTICVDNHDYFLVNKAVSLLQQDIERVTLRRPVVTNKLSGDNLIIIGSVGRSSLIKKLAAKKNIDTSDLAGKWETYKLQVVKHPFEGVEKALVIMGSDRQGTAYGVFTLSRQMGVSPWYWWADVPVKKKKEVFVKEGTYNYGSPAVKYRGIFLNDEAPALSGWVREKFGDLESGSRATNPSTKGYNHHFYVHVFELLLRLRANYLWPAMWNNSFDVDDTLNPILANKYGIVMGTAHNEPMMRSRKEWRDFGNGPWDYETNAATLDSFWKQGIRRMDDRQSIVTIGMRGNGDKAMSKETNIALLEKIVAKQRRIIEEVTGKPASETPQDWALYKEVQDYYDEGMRVPEDVTLLYADDNWGNIRRLPELKDSAREGGYGLYYHFDYVGGPRNYKWINTNQISRIWEQMHLAYQYHVRKIWIVNVGDLKPMEFPISFFLDEAWHADKWTVHDMENYTSSWVEEQFGAENVEKITNIINEYTRYNSRCKPELLSSTTYSLNHYKEAERVVNDYQYIARQAHTIYEKLPKAYKPAFYQLVLYPVETSANLNELYVTVAKNRLYAKQGRAMTNELGARAKLLFIKDSLLSHFYNKVMENGRWDHMMDQTHIGYTNWQEPPHNNMPKTDSISIPKEADMGVAIQSSDEWYPDASDSMALPVFDRHNRQKYEIEIFNRGQDPFSFKIQKSKPWIQVSQISGKLELQKRIMISIDWKRVPEGELKAFITVEGPKNQHVRVYIKIDNRAVLSTANQLSDAFLESNGVISIEAAHYCKAVETKGMRWATIPGLGRTLSGVTALPVTAPAVNPVKGSPYLEYKVYIKDTGSVYLSAYLSPTLNFQNNPEGLRFAVSIDDHSPEIVNMAGKTAQEKWAKWVSDNVNIQKVDWYIRKPGIHRIKFWLVDPGVVLQKIVMDFGGLKSSYLGPPESYRF